MSFFSHFLWVFLLMVMMMMVLLPFRLHIWSHSNNLNFLCCALFKWILSQQDSRLFMWILNSRYAGPRNYFFQSLRHIQNISQFNQYIFFGGVWEPSPLNHIHSSSFPFRIRLNCSQSQNHFVEPWNIIHNFISMTHSTKSSPPNQYKLSDEIATPCHKFVAYSNWQQPRTRTAHTIAKPCSDEKKKQFNKNKRRTNAQRNKQRELK